MEIQNNFCIFVLPKDIFMKVNASKIQLNNDILERGFKWYEKNVSLKNAEKNNQYLVIYWDDLSVEDFEKILPTLDKYHISGYLDTQNIDNKEIIYLMLKHVETPNEEYLWTRVVDSERLISHELYLENTYRENFELWYKVYKKRIVKIKPPESDISVEEIISLMDAKHIPQAKIKEQNRIDRVNNWLDSIIDIDFVKENKEGAEINFMKLEFKNGVKMLQFGFYQSSLKQIPQEEKDSYYVDLSGEKAMILILSKNKISNVIFYPEFQRLLQDNHELPKTDVDYYVVKWFKNKVSDWKEKIQ